MKRSNSNQSMTSQVLYEFEFNLNDDRYGFDTKGLFINAIQFYGIQEKWDKIGVKLMCIPPSEKYPCLSLFYYIDTEARQLKAKKALEAILRPIGGPVYEAVFTIMQREMSKSYQNKPLSQKSNLLDQSYLQCEEKMMEDSSKKIKYN